MHARKCKAKKWKREKNEATKSPNPFQNKTRKGRKEQKDQPKCVAIYIDTRKLKGRTSCKKKLFCCKQHLLSFFLLYGFCSFLLSFLSSFLVVFWVPFNEFKRALREETGSFIHYYLRNCCPSPPLIESIFFSLFVFVLPFSRGAHTHGKEGEKKPGRSKLPFFLSSPPSPQYKVTPSIHFLSLSLSSSLPCSVHLLLADSHMLLFLSHPSIPQATHRRQHRKKKTEHTRPHTYICMQGKKSPAMAFSLQKPVSLFLSLSLISLSLTLCYPLSLSRLRAHSLSQPLDGDYKNMHIIKIKTRRQLGVDLFRLFFSFLPFLPPLSAH